jgi:hypothetical protein
MRLKNLRASFVSAAVFAVPVCFLDALHLRVFPGGTCAYASLSTHKLPC